MYAVKTLVKLAGGALILALLAFVASFIVVLVTAQRDALAKPL